MRKESSFGVVAACGLMKTGYQNRITRFTGPGLAERSKIRECSSPFASSVCGIPALTAAQGGTPEIPPPIGLTQVHITLRLEMGKQPEAFTLNVPTADIADLSERLART